MRLDIRDEVATFFLQLHQLLDSHQRLCFLVSDLTNDELFKCGLIAITRLERKGVELVIDFSGVVNFKNALGTAHDLFKVKSGLAIFLNFLLFSGFYDFFCVFRKSMPLWVSTICHPDEGAKADTSAFEGVPSVFTGILTISPLMSEVRVF